MGYTVPAHLAQFLWLNLRHTMAGLTPGYLGNLLLVIIISFVQQC